MAKHHNTITKAALIVGVLMLAATPVMAQTTKNYSVDNAVNACASEVRTQYPRFAAFVVNDGEHNRVKTFGTDRANFVFEFCMNDVGLPLHIR
jgi:hypothetical protein